MRAVVIAGTESGAGKTTVAIGIMAALKRRGYKVQPFKVGPDYIDPSYHAAACGLPSRNLDTWLMPAPAIVELFDRAMRGKDVGVVEGVMGLYDGFSGDADEGSTAHLAKLLGLPVVLVVDASSSARSVGASVLGFKSFDPHLNLAGVILNGIASEKHLEFVKPALNKAAVPLLGYLPGRKDLALPERHLGLIPTAEGTVASDFYARLAIQAEQSIDLDGLLLLASRASGPSVAEPILFPEHKQPPRTALAVAVDKAFSFYYPDSLDLLEAWGAEIVPFSPLADSAVPPGIGGIYIGGGFPELYAQELSENHGMLISLREAADRGVPIYAECGGLMYLGESIEDQDEKNYPMAGVIPALSFLRGTRLTLGYRTVRALEDGPLLRAGESARGHEFHLSALREEPPPDKAAYEIVAAGGRREGFRLKNVLASYVHLHFASERSMAPRFVEFCARWVRACA